MKFDFEISRVECIGRNVPERMKRKLLIEDLSSDSVRSCVCVCGVGSSIR